MSPACHLPEIASVANHGGTLVSYMKAIEAGCDIVDTALSSMSLGPGQNPTESQLYCAAIQG
jgi:pyruvate/oxaloacetate carboxyltransferase